MLRTAQFQLQDIPENCEDSKNIRVRQALRWWKEEKVTRGSIWNF